MTSDEPLGGRLYIDWCGIKLGPFDSEEAARIGVVQHQAACIQEGICPTHRTRLLLHPRPGYCAKGQHVWTVNEADKEWGWVGEDYVGPMPWEKSE
jgi:hypothetical protein